MRAHNFFFFVTLFASGMTVSKAGGSDGEGESSVVFAPVHGMSDVIRGFPGAIESIDGDSEVSKDAPGVEATASESDTEASVLFA